MTSYSDAIRAGDVADFCELIWRKGVGDCAETRTGLGGPEGPEPGKPSPRCRAPSHIAKENEA